MNIKELFKSPFKQKSQAKTAQAYYWTFESLHTEGVSAKVTTYSDNEERAWNALQCAMEGKEYIHNDTFHIVSNGVKLPTNSLPCFQEDGCLTLESRGKIYEALETTDENVYAALEIWKGDVKHGF